MKLGRLFGILAILGGGYVTYMGYEMMQTTGSVFKFVIAAPVFVLTGSLINRTKRLYKMEKPLTHLIINWIEVDHQRILVGATDNEHWNLEKEFGGSGADAKSSVWVTLKDHGKRHGISEETHFFCFPGDPVRSLAMSRVFYLFETAWNIKNQNMNLEAREKFFGKILEGIV